MRLTPLSATASALCLASALSVVLLILPTVGAAAGQGAVPHRPAHTCSGPTVCPGDQGNILISDQFNNRAIEVDPKNNRIVWTFGSDDPTRCNPGPGAVIGPNDAERLSGGLTLVPGTGVPAGASPADPKFACSDNRVIVVSHSGRIVWQYGKAGVTGAGPNQLNVPVFAIQLPNRNIMIVDQGNNRVIVVGRFSKRIVWSYGPASGPGALNSPNSAELLPNGHVLIADENNNRVIEVTHAGRIVWQYGSGKPKVTKPLDVAAFASRLPNGDTLITDAGHSRIVEVSKSKRVVWQYFTNRGKNSNPAPLPTNAVRLGSYKCGARRRACPEYASFSGDTLIADQYNHRVIVVTKKGRVVYQYGKTNVFGTGRDRLDGPYTAELIGDYTGQTPPPSKF